MLHTSTHVTARVKIAGGFRVDVALICSCILENIDAGKASFRVILQSPLFSSFFDIGGFLGWRGFCCEKWRRHQSKRPSRTFRYPLVRGARAPAASPCASPAGRRSSSLPRFVIFGYVNGFRREFRFSVDNGFCSF